MRVPIESFRYFTRIITRFEEELRPVTADRKDKASFCYNSGRIIAAIGPFVVGRIASMGVDALAFPDADSAPFTLSVEVCLSSSRNNLNCVGHPGV
jgi:hypothetical protein